MSQESDTNNQRIDFSAMGTEFFCIVIGSTSEICEALVSFAYELEAKWSRFQPNSELMNLNNNPNAEIEVSDFTLRLLSEIQFGYELTSGLFDANVLDSMIFSGFSESRSSRGLHTNWATQTNSDATVADIEIDFANKTAKIPQGVGIDAGGVGKGLAADLMAEYALALGAKGIGIFSGGDVSVKGLSKDMNGWEIGISNPHNVKEFVGSVNLSRGGLATSSPLGWQNSKLMTHHIIDPRTKKSSNEQTLQATVVAANASHADMLTKMCLLLPVDKAIGEIERLHADAMLISNQNEIHTTATWQELAC